MKKKNPHQNQNFTNSQKYISQPLSLYDTVSRHDLVIITELFLVNWSWSTHITSQASYITNILLLILHTVGCAGHEKGLSWSYFRMQLN